MPTPLTANPVCRSFLFLKDVTRRLLHFLTRSASAMRWIRRDHLRSRKKIELSGACVMIAVVLVGNDSGNPTPIMPITHGNKEIDR